MMKKFFAIFMTLMMCMSMCVIVSAHEDHIHDASMEEAIELAAVSYPACSSCGGTTRTFSASGSSSHIVRCRNCNAYITSESCEAYSEATCTGSANCICGREMEAPLGHAYATAALDSSCHGRICTRYGCSYNPNSYNYTGSFTSEAHAITYSYADYTHNSTGERWHSKSGTCSVCGYNYYTTTRCANQGKVCNRLSCFGD